MGTTPVARASAGLPAGGPPPSPSTAAAAQAVLRELHFGVRLAEGTFLGLLIIAAAVIGRFWRVRRRSTA